MVGVGGQGSSIAFSKEKTGNNDVMETETDASRSVLLHIIMHRM